MSAVKKVLGLILFPNVYLSARFFILLSSIAGIFVLSFPFPDLSLRVILLALAISGFLFSNFGQLSSLYKTLLNAFIIGVVSLLFTFVPYPSTTFLDLPIGGIQLFALAQSLLIAFTGFVFVDALLLFNPSVKKLIKGKRILPNMFSLGDPNSVEIKLSNNYFLSLGLTIIDELPDQFQKRDFEIKDRLPRGEEQTFKYKLTPTERGEYVFHNLNIFINGFLNLVNRRLIVDSTNQVAVYPSVLQMKKFELMAISRISTFQGVKKVRRLGHSYEFEQIRNYVKGDDYRSINWKATSRRNDLMVNQYEDERSQQIFSVIDKGRSMKMPFNGLSLMDYAINTSLVISNVALHKHDKAGLLTFSDKVGATVKADSGPRQLRTILEALYKEQERNLEANFELLYSACKKFIRRRSLMFLYTNFESYTSMVRVLPILRKINRLHLLVVIFFENTEIVDFAQQSAQNVEEIYNKTIAGRFVEEKYRIVRELRQYGIQSILTRPENLSLNTVNKYLELKARGMI